MERQHTYPQTALPGYILSFLSQMDKIHLTYIAPGPLIGPEGIF